MFLLFLPFLERCLIDRPANTRGTKFNRITTSSTIWCQNTTLGLSYTSIPFCWCCRLLNHLVSAIPNHACPLAPSPLSRSLPNCLLLPLPRFASLRPPPSVPTANDQLTILLPRVTFASGYVLYFVNGSNVNQVYAESQPFEIAQGISEFREVSSLATSSCSPLFSCLLFLAFGYSLVIIYQLPPIFLYFPTKANLVFPGYPPPPLRLPLITTRSTPLFHTGPTTSVKSGLASASTSIKSSTVNIPGPVTVSLS